MKTDQKRRPGRPMGKFPKAKSRVQIATQISGALKKRIMEEAIANGRSLSRQFEFLLELAFDRELQTEQVIRQLAGPNSKLLTDERAQ